MAVGEAFGGGEQREDFFAVAGGEVIPEPSADGVFFLGGGRQASLTDEGTQIFEDAVKGVSVFCGCIVGLPCDNKVGSVARGAVAGEAAGFEDVIAT